MGYLTYTFDFCGGSVIKGKSDGLTTEMSVLTEVKDLESVLDYAADSLFYPAFCIPDDANAGKMMFAKFEPDNLPDIIRCGPMKLGKCYVEDVIKMNPFEEIKGYKKDVLIIHGAKDKIVTIQKGRLMYIKTVFRIGMSDLK